MRRPRAKYYDLSSVIIGARVDKPSQTGRRVPDVKVSTKEKYRGLCVTCGGARHIQTVVGRIACPACTGYQG